ncbi:MAG: hypothetical protein EON54_14250 [Alcaligenaceae bacterium]|nr:MAG: hypothetical protein EON54_14250 [Alcaligenaceae bacterium]
MFRRVLRPAAHYAQRHPQVKRVAISMLRLSPEFHRKLQVSLAPPAAEPSLAAAHPTERALTPAALAIFEELTALIPPSRRMKRN